MPCCPSCARHRRRHASSTWRALPGGSEARRRYRTPSRTSPSTCRRSQQPAAVDETAAPERPLTLSTIDRARTVAAAAVSTGGSLSTLCRSNGEPFGSFVDYVLDAEGMPVTLLAEQSEWYSERRAQWEELWQ